MRKSLIAALAAFPLLVTLPGVHAQGGAPEPTPAQRELMQMKQQIETLQQEVGQIQKAAMEKNPDLKRQQQELAGLISDTAKAKGFDGSAAMKELSALQQRYKEGDLTLEEKQKLAAEFSAKQTALREAQAEILQDEAVEKARGRFASELASAMQAVDPTAEAKIAKLKSLAQDFRAKLMAAMQQHGGMMGQ